MIWKCQVMLEQFNWFGEGNMVGLFDICFEIVIDDMLEVIMLVDSCIQQLFGLLYGGVLVVLVEILGLVVGYLCSEGE